MPPLHTNLSQQQNQQSQQARPQASPFLETVEWEGRILSLVYNPFDETRSQMRPDYTRLLYNDGGCFLVKGVDEHGNPVDKYLIIMQFTCPTEPGTMVPTQQFYAFRLNDHYVPNASQVDIRTLIFYGINPQNQHGKDNLGQRFLNALLGIEAAQMAPQPKDDSWVKDFAGLQQQLARPATAQSESNEEAQS